MLFNFSLYEPIKYFPNMYKKGKTSYLGYLVFSSGLPNSTILDYIHIFTISVYNLINVRQLYLLSR